MSSFNRITLVGRLTADPECRFLNNGTAVTSFTMAVDRGFKNQQGEKETDFIKCVAWKQLAEVVAKNLTKGRLILADGRLQIRSYDKDGERRTVAEVVANTVQFLDYPKDERPAQGQSYEPGDDDDLGF